MLQWQSKERAGIRSEQPKQNIKNYEQYYYTQRGCADHKAVNVHNLQADKSRKAPTQ